MQEDENEVEKEEHSKDLQDDLEVEAKANKK